MISRNDPCWCGSGKKWKKCHWPQLPNEDIAKRYLKSYNIIVKTPKQIDGIKQASKLAAKILDELCKKAKAGVTTNDLDLLSMELHKKAGAKPAPLGYGEPPFPKSICTSLNDEICHGIPNDIPLKDGDIINIDVTSILNGYFGDCSRMVIIGDEKKLDEEKLRVTEVSYECMMEAIKICKPGIHLCEIGNVIEEIASQNKCSVVNQFVGHGVGVHFHEDPQVAHHYNNMHIPMVKGMTFTIEPMINAGVRSAVLDDNHWTARTKDGKPSAQWEHTIAITENGHEILTLL